MLSIQNNLLAMNANNFLKINSGNSERTTEKLSSGYRINRAADDAAGLAISEKMRRQIRGLRQGTFNAQDGISFVQVADGAMDEVHSMLQRMNELAVRSLNGTCAESDRAALNAEFDWLREEIDRINNQTEYNEQPVFDEHESSYYQISGNISWDDNRLHTIPAMNNDLNIHLPDYYDPNEYTLTVPSGVYTTQELIDEIDSALESMTPSNPGFVFEYTDQGICKLNFERADGTPAEIDSVDGSLSYLLFDSEAGSSSSSLMGTTVFDARYPLTITRNQNDQLGFYVENAQGTNFVSMTIPPGKYSRSEMIDLINKNLDGTGVIAKEYENSSIQITGGDGTSITGLTGNMFKLELGAETVYSSVFYDNVRYGNSQSAAAYVSGRAYYGEPVTDKIYLSSSNMNNVLSFKANGATEYTKITFPEKPDGYTIKEIRDEIYKQLDEKKLLNEVTVSTGSTSVYLAKSPTESANFSVQILTLSSLIKGDDSSLEFDTTDPVAVNTYNALFRDTNYLPYVLMAELKGSASLSGTITLPDSASLSFQVNDQSYTISGIGGSYQNCQALVNEMNARMDPALNGKIEFSASNSPSGPIAIRALTDDIQKIEFDDGQKNDTYKQLFVGTVANIDSANFNYSYGTVSRPQGSTEVTATLSTASVTSNNIRTTDINITDDTRTLSFYSSEGTKTVTLATGTCSIADIVAQINAQLKPSGTSRFTSITASYEKNKLTLTATLSTDNANGSYNIRFDPNGSAWQAILGTHESGHTVRQGNVLGTRNNISFPITLDNNSNELTLTIGQDSGTIHIDGTYSDSNSLQAAIEAAIKGNNTLKDKISVNITDGRLIFISPSGSVTASGSFYDKVTQKTATEYTVDGYTRFNEAYIIGRKDLTTDYINIVSGANDTFIFNFAYTEAPNSTKNYTKEMQVTIPEDIYTGDEIAEILQELIQKKFEDEGIKDFDIAVSIGGENTNVVGANDDTALQIKVTRRDGKEPANGQYVLDGIRGTAAGFLFYKTTINPNATYITGTKDLSSGVLFEPEKNVFTFSSDSVPYQYTFPENTKYTAEEFVNLLNDKFENGDDNGKSAPLTASLENGFLKITHKALGSHSITDIGGSAKDTLFLEKSGRKYRDPIYILVGAETEDKIEIPRTRVSSCSLAVNSITVSRPKYAEKAVKRIKSAIAMLSSRRSTYGSMQNRLEHTVKNNNNVIENTQASESAIRDADIAYEAVKQAKNSILMQVSQTVLAQANQQPDMILKLLQP